MTCLEVDGDCTKLKEVDYTKLKNIFVIGREKNDCIKLKDDDCTNLK